MPNAQSPRIHPTAIISPQADLADDIQVGPYVIIEGEVHVGKRCVLRPYVHLCGPLRMGEGNFVGSGVVLGERPQHLKYRDEPTSLEIGDNNIFREHVTIHRGTTQSWKTRIGNENYFMAQCHVGHDCQVGNRCILANGALVAGHCVIEDNVYLSGNCAIHQFTRLGRLCLLSGTSVTTKDIPPFVMQQGINCVVGVNAIGMRRAGMTSEQIHAVRRAFHIIYGQESVLSSAMKQVEEELGTVDAVREMLAFIRASTRGINLMRDRGREEAA